VRGTSRYVGVLRIRRQRFPIPLVGGETREIDERQPDVGRPGELRRREVADDLAAAALDGTNDAAPVRLEIGELRGVQRVADAQCGHDVLLSGRVWSRAARASTPNASILPESFTLAQTVRALSAVVMGEAHMLSTV